MLAQAIESEVQLDVESRSDLRDQEGRQQVVRNGHLPERSIQSAIGELPVKQPRVRDRRPKRERENFQPIIVPRYLRRTK